MCLRFVSLDGRRYYSGLDHDDHSRTENRRCVQTPDHLKILHPMRSSRLTTSIKGIDRVVALILQTEQHIHATEYCSHHQLTHSTKKREWFWVLIFIAEHAVSTESTANSLTRLIVSHVFRLRSDVRWALMTKMSVLVATDSAKYLGITISNDLKWNKHVSNITSKANSTLGILRRNLRLSSHTVKTHAYQALVRPHLGYASAVWDPHTHYNTHKLEMVQRRAARYVCNRWHNTSSVTGMLSQLEWVPLATRRANTRLCMMYRVAHTPVGDPWTPWLTFAQRTTRGSHAWKYIPISTSHDAYKFSFLPRTIIAWNQLPSIIITAPSIDAFRSRLITSQP